MAMRTECKHFESRTYANGDTMRRCNLGLAPDAPDEVDRLHDRHLLGRGHEHDPGARVVLDRGDRGVADAPLGHVDDALGADEVLRVHEEAQVREEVLDLAPLVEPHAADEAEPDLAVLEDVLKDAALGIRPVEDGDVGGLEPLLLAQAGDLLGDEPGLLVLVLGAVADRELAVPRLGPERLGLALAVVGDQRVRDAEDRLRRAVVLLHEEHGRVGVVALEVEEVLDRRAAPGVHALVGVADDAEVPVTRREEVHEAVLRAARVLVLVHHEVAEPRLPRGEHVGVVAEQADGRTDEVVEVERTGAALAVLVGEVDLRDGLLVDGDCRVGELLGGGEGVLSAADRRGDGPRGEPLRVHVELLEDAGDEPLRVAVVVDREGRGQAEALVFAPQDARAGRVEGEDPHPLRDPAADELLDALDHLARRLVRERDREDGARRDPLLPDQVGDPVGQGPGLPRPRAGHDEHRTVRVEDGLALDGVERRHEGGGGHDPMVGVGTDGTYSHSIVPGGLLVTS